MTRIWIGALVGGVLGGAIDGVGGAVVGGFVGVLLGVLFQLIVQARDMQALTLRLDRLVEAQEQLAARIEEGMSPAAVHEQTAEPDHVPPPHAAAEAAESEPLWADGWVDEPPVSSSQASARSGEPWGDGPSPMPGQQPYFSLLDPPIKFLREFFTTGNVVARLGVIILFFGLAFLLKYAAERSVFPLELRLAGVALGGVALLVGGWRLRRHGGYGLTLQGAGVGTLYLTIFTALRLYDLLPPVLAFGLLVLLVIFSTALALLQDSRSLATLGAAGGFLAPVLTSSGDGSHVLLFSYYALLNAGILAVAWHRAWRELNLLGFVFTFVIAAFWGYQAYRPELFASTQPFLALFFLFYLAIAVLYAHRKLPHLNGYVDGTLVFGVPLAGFGLQAGLMADFHYGMAFSAVIVGGIYLGLASALWQRQVEGMRLLVEAFLALGVMFLTLAIPLAFDGGWTAAIWALEGAALVWVGVRQQRLSARLAGILLQVGAGVAFTLHVDAFSVHMPILNGLYLGGVLLSLAALFTGAYLNWSFAALRQVESRLLPLVLGWGLLWWFGAGFSEIQRQLTGGHALHAGVLFLALSALALDRLAHRVRWRDAGYPAVGLLPLLALIVWFVAAESGQAHVFTLWGAIAWSVAGGVHLALLRSRETVWPATLIPLWHMGGLWLTLAVLAWESVWAAGLLVPEGSAWRFAAWMLVPVIALFFLTRARWPHWPVARIPKAYQKEGLLPVAGVLWLWLLQASTVAASSAPLPYVPLLNPVELAQIAVMLVLLRWWLALWRQTPPVEHAPLLLPIALGGGAFMALNGVLARAVHNFADVPFTLADLFASFWFQSGLSILWSLLAMSLMAFGGHRHLRVVWFVGAALLGVVVVKLFFLELANAGTIGRIVSFVGVGLLMLLIGYLSPLPPRRAEEKPL